VKIVADSAPLITLAKIAQLDILPQLYRSILVTPEVYGEVAVTGAGLAGAAEIAAAEWIEVHSLKDTARLAGPWYRGSQRNSSRNRVKCRRGSYGRSRWPQGGLGKGHRYRRLRWSA
jgi:hypothetical protein